MDKILFWVQVVIVAAIGIYLMKAAASQTNIQGLRDFTQAI